MDERNNVIPYLKNIENDYHDKDYRNYESPDYDPHLFEDIEENYMVKDSSIT